MDEGEERFAGPPQVSGDPTNGQCARSYATGVRKWVVILVLCIAGVPCEVRAEDLCSVLARPKDFAGRFLSIQASVKPTMHGTYLKQPGCADSILVVLPEEIAHLSRFGEPGEGHPI
jgi:hypothetical protein